MHEISSAYIRSTRRTFTFKPFKKYIRGDDRWSST